jgi:hypothetical protein
MDWIGGQGPLRDKYIRYDESLAVSITRGDEPLNARVLDVVGGDRGQRNLGQRNLLRTRRCFVLLRVDSFAPIPLPPLGDIRGSAACVAWNGVKSRVLKWDSTLRKFGFFGLKGQSTIA